MITSRDVRKAERVAMSENLPLITVIVAVFNGADTLQRCIDSIAEQTYPDRELVVMDGGSTDGTIELLQTNNAKITYWETESDRGIYHAWNKALDRAKGEWICFLGADDHFADKTSLATLASRARPRAELVLGRIALVDEKGRTLKLEGSPWNWKRMKRYQVIAHPATLQRWSLFEEYGQFDEKYRIAGDYEFFLRLGADVRTSYIERVVVYCRTGGASRSQLSHVLKEIRQIQSSHPEIGAYRAWINYSILVTKVTLRKLLRGF
jgi:glycosyltransferase involved in cell wall biosynthesis